MRKVFRVIAAICLAFSGLLGILGLLTLDPGGLMFALPYFFLIPAALFLFIGIVLFILTRKPKEGVEEEKQVSQKRN